MKVMLVADCVGGVFSYSLELADALHGDGVDVVLAVMGRELARDQREELQRRPWLCAEARPFRMLWMGDAGDDVQEAGRWLLDLCTRHRPDVVQLGDYAHATLPWPVPVVLVLHSCVHSWFRAVRRAAPPAGFGDYGRAVAAAVAAADLVVAPTQAMLDAFAACHGPVPRARVIHNGIAAAAAAPAAPAGVRRHEAFLAVGRVWDEAKNVAQLARVAPAVPWPIVVAGSTQHPAGGAAAPPGLRLCGERPRPEVAALLARAAVLVHPARYEPFGLAPLEAAAAGCALVLADIPSLRELWNGAAEFAPVDDDAAWIAAMRRCARKPHHRHRLAQRAAERAGRFTAARMAAAYRTAYAELLQHRVASPA